MVLIFLFALAILPVADGYVSDSGACEDGGLCNAVHSNSLLQTVNTREREMHSKAGLQSVNALEDGALNKLNAVFYRAQSERLAKESAYFEQYTKYNLLMVMATNLAQMDMLKKLEDDHAEIAGLVDWEAAEMSGTQCLVVPPSLVDEVKNNLTHGGLTHAVMSSDFAHDIEEEHAANVNAFNPAAPYDIVGRVPSVDELYAWLKLMEMQHETVKLFDYGNSSQNRPLKVMRIRRQDLSKSQIDRLPIVLVTCSMHGREWITMPACVYWINALLTNKTDAWLMDKVEWHFLPMYNPDGFDRSQRVNRMWRKNVREVVGFSGDSYCQNYGEDFMPGSFNTVMQRSHKALGVDLNRNFDTSSWGKEYKVLYKVYRNWDGSVAENYSKIEKPNNFKPCHEQYAGQAPMSEPENSAFAAWVMKHKERIKVYHDIHALGQMWLIPPGAAPWGPEVVTFESNSKEDRTNLAVFDLGIDSDLEEIAKEAARRTGLKFGKKYTSGTPIGSGLAPYPGGGGGSFDWAYDNVRGPGIKYVFASELRPTVPTSPNVEHAINALTVKPGDIEESALEYWEGIKYTISVALAADDVETTDG